MIFTNYKSIHPKRYPPIARIFFLLLIFLLPLKLFSQCPPVVTVDGDTITVPGPITITATGCADCVFEWYDSTFTLLSDQPILSTSIMSKTLFYLVVIDNLNGCDNYDPDTGYPDSVWAVVSSSLLDTSLYGDGVWNVYCFNNISFSNYAGYYIDSSDFSGNSLVINSGLKWAQGCTDCNYTLTDSEYYGQMASPFISNAPKDNKSYKVSGYIGQEVSNDFHSIRYKRKNFPPGNYQIDIDKHDDVCWVLINGVEVFYNSAPQTSHLDCWRGYLDETSTVEFRWRDGALNSIGNFKISKIPDVPAIQGYLWTVYCYNDTTYSKFAGYYTDSADFTDNSLVVNSGLKWAEGCIGCSYSKSDDEKYGQLASPYFPKASNGMSYLLPGYTGTQVLKDYHSIRYVRKGFPAGNYQFDVDNHDDGCQLYINDVLVYTHNSTGKGLVNVWRGYLDANSTVEFRWKDGVVNSTGNFRLSLIPDVPSIQDGLWTAYCYNDQNFSTFSGYYIDSADIVNGRLSVNTGKIWAKGCKECTYSSIEDSLNFSFLASPYASHDMTDDNKEYKVPGYKGGQISKDYHSISYVRKGFPSGNYQLDIGMYDDDVWVIINGVQVFYKKDVPLESAVNVWRGLLDASSTVEIRWKENNNPSFLIFTLSEIIDEPSLTDGLWTVYCYNQTNFTEFAGYYIDSTDFDDDHLKVRPEEIWANGCTNCTPPFDSIYWAQYATPFIEYVYGWSYKVPGYKGNMVKHNFNSISYKRKSFPSGYYQFDIDDHDDGCWLYINDSLAFTHDGYQHGHKNVWRGYLDESSVVEFKWYDGYATSIGNFTMTKLQVAPVLKAPFVGQDLSICYNGDPSVFGALLATEDASIRNGSFADIPYGTITSGLLGVRNYTGDDGGIEYALLKFDLSGVNETTITDTKLMLTGYVTDTASGGIRNPNVYLCVYPLIDTTWKELTVSWSNPPEGLIDNQLGAPLDSTVIYDEKKNRYELNVTDYVKSQFDLGIKNISFAIKINYDNNSPHIFYKFISKDNTTITDKPALIINSSEGCTLSSYQWQVDSTGSFENISASSGGDKFIYHPSSASKNSSQYRLVTKDVCGNISVSDTIHVNIINPVTPIIPDTFVCGQQPLTFTPSNSDYTYRWFNESSSSYEVSDSYTISSYDKDTSIFYFIAQQGNCVSSIKNNFKVISYLNSKGGRLYSPDSIVCETGNPSINLLDHVGSVETWLYSTDGFETVDSINQKGTTLFIKDITSKVSYKAVVRNHSCPSDTSSPVTISIVQKTIPGQIERTVNNDMEGELSLTGYVGSILRWEVSEDSSFSNYEIIDDPSPVILYTYQPGKDRYFRAVVKSGTCPADSANVYLMDRLFVYTSFTPNQDGINDLWMIGGIDQYVNNEVKIFDRWGNLIYDEIGYNNSDKAWRGNANVGGGGQLPEGTYFYAITIKDQEMKTGYVVLKK